MVEKGQSRGRSFEKEHAIILAKVPTYAASKTSSTQAAEQMQEQFKEAKP